MNMTPREATELAERIIKTWPNGPRQGIWFDMLTQHCEHDPAWTVYRQHRDTDERGPSIAGFLATYRRHVGRHDRTTSRCPTCDGTGMRSARQVIGGVEQPVVVACADCATGVGAARVLVAIDTANATANAGRRRPAGLVQVDAHTADGPDMSFTEYLTRLTARAEQGDPEAIDMLAIWDANETQGRTRGGWHPSMGRES